MKRRAMINLRRVTQGDCRDIWHWRNCLKVRKSSFNSKPIQWHEHKRWFDLKLRDKNTKIYIAKRGIKKAGVIRFEKKNKLLTVNVNLNPEFFGKGLGSRIIKLGTIRSLREYPQAGKVVAEVISDNIAAKKAFGKSGYVFARKTKKNSKEVDVFEFRKSEIGTDGRIRKAAILTSKDSWFVPYARRLIMLLKGRSYQARVFYKHRDIPRSYGSVFILSYGEIIDQRSLDRHRYNLVVHGSALPKGRGWAPLFWQILEGKSDIPIVLFNATSKVDAGDIYIKDSIKLKGDELCQDIRRKQAEKTISMCLQFIDNYADLRPKRQRGTASFYKKRTPADSELEMDKSLKDQFNLLRIVDNDRFPAFFRYRGRKYILKIRAADKEE